MMSKPIWMENGLNGERSDINKINNFYYYIILERTIHSHELMPSIQ